MAYRITVERVVTNTFPETEWKLVADTGNKHDGKSVYEYVPTGRTLERTDRVEVYQQSVSELDFQKLVACVNDIDM